MERVSQVNGRPCSWRRKKCTDSTSQNSELTVSQANQSFSIGRPDVEMQPAHEGAGGQIEEQQVSHVVWTPEPHEQGEHAHGQEGGAQHGRQFLLQPLAHLVAGVQRIGRAQPQRRQRHLRLRRMFEPEQDFTHRLLTGALLQQQPERRARAVVQRAVLLRAVHQASVDVDRDRAVGLDARTIQCERPRAHGLPPCGQPDPGGADLAGGLVRRGEGQGRRQHGMLPGARQGLAVLRERRRCEVSRIRNLPVGLRQVQARRSRLRAAGRQVPGAHGHQHGHREDEYHMGEEGAGAVSHAAFRVWRGLFPGLGLARGLSGQITPTPRAASQPSRNRQGKGTRTAPGPVGRASLRAAGLRANSGLAAAPGGIHGSTGCAQKKLQPGSGPQVFHHRRALRISLSSGSAWGWAYRLGSSCPKPFHSSSRRKCCRAPARILRSSSASVQWPSQAGRPDSQVRLSAGCTRCGPVSDSP
jgi:hypothetical protein